MKSYLTKFNFLVKYRDASSRAESIIKMRHNVSDDMTIFFIEIELETHQMEISEETVAYPLGWYKITAYSLGKDQF